MKLDIKKTGETTRDLNIEVSPESLKDIKKKTLEKIKKEVNISGFRKGKAPLDVVEKKFPDQVRSHIMEEAVPFYYNKAVTENNLEVISRPQVKDAAYKDGTLYFTASVELKPQIELDSKVYKNIKVKQKAVSVEDKEIKKFIEDMREKVAKTLDKKKEEVDNSTVYKWAAYKNEEELKKSIKNEIYLNKIVQRRKNIEKQITDTLLSKINFSIPQSILEEQKKRLMDYQMQDLKQKGISEEEIKKHYDELTKRVETMAKDQIKLFYVLEAIAQKEKLKHDQDNIYQVVIGFILTTIIK